MVAMVFLSFVLEADRLDELAETLELVPDARGKITVDFLRSTLARKTEFTVSNWLFVAQAPRLLR